MCTQENILPFKVGKWDLNSHKISFYLNFISSVQSLSHVWLFVTPWTAARRASLSSTISWSLLKPMSIESVMPSSHLILCHPLLLPSVFPSIRSFLMSWLFTSDGQNIGALALAPVLPVNIQGWFPLGWTSLISLLSKRHLTLVQHHSSKASILQCSAFFMVQLSYPCMTTGKTRALIIWTFVSKVMSLRFNTLSMFVIAFLPRSKHLLISWLQSPSTVILEPRKLKSVTISTFSKHKTDVDFSDTLEIWR